MSRILTEGQLLNAFRTLDREEVILLQEMKFPLEFEGYFSWIEPSGARAYLIFDESQGKSDSLPKGVVFRRGPVGTMAAMCEWCHSVRGGSEVGLMTVTANSKQRIGIHLCRDLGCKERINSIPGIHDLPERLDPDERFSRILERMASFSRRYLF